MSVSITVSYTHLGQSSKSSQASSIAKFAAGGKATAKKDLGQIAMAYGHVYVAQISMGANPMQTIKAMEEAEAYDEMCIRDRLSVSSIFC